MWSFQLATLYSELLEQIAHTSSNRRHVLSAIGDVMKTFSLYRPNDTILHVLHIGINECLNYQNSHLSPSRGQKWETVFCLLNPNVFCPLLSPSVPLIIY